MINKDIMDKAISRICSTDEGREIMEVLEKLPLISGIIPIDLQVFEIQQENNRSYIIDGERKVYLPLEFNVGDDEFYQFYKIVKTNEGKEVVQSKEYENSELYIETICASLKFYLDSFEEGFPVKEHEYKVYQALMIMCKGMIEARFSEKVLKRIGELDSLVRESGKVFEEEKEEFSHKIYIKQVEIFEAYRSAYDEIEEQYKIVEVEKGA